MTDIEAVQKSLTELANNTNDETLPAKTCLVSRSGCVA